MKIGHQKPTARDTSTSTQPPPPPRTHHGDAAEASPQRDAAPPPPRVSDPTVQHSALREPLPPTPAEHDVPVVPDHPFTAGQPSDDGAHAQHRDYAYTADSPIAILRHINAAYPPIIHYTLHIGMLVKDLHEKIGECHAWCEAAVGAGMGGEPAVRETMGALERLRFVVPRGVGRNWIG
ncbi:hypothetical protein P171DRAFT_479583 [Karstenula rhodostoma CBS 690.94]|uniref:Uncharacterized protein n=1 Tax=Karstenula rhodostoma CBS 690.94 TaxID=1392251 RepID=A0A9P4PWF7_9PLEO|nr:hypothetical protein P171DRAFT_479583 [Karstenula rhodostoma CBS 690.94]